MREKPTPIVVCSASVESDELNDHHDAAAAPGRLPWWKSPSGPPARITSARANALHPAGDHERSQSGAATGDSPRSPQRIGSAKRRPASARRLPSAVRSPRRARALRVLGIGASTGGPNAVVQVLTDLGQHFPSPDSARAAHDADLSRRVRVVAAGPDAVSRGPRTTRRVPGSRHGASRTGGQPSRDSRAPRSPVAGPLPRCSVHLPP